MRIFYTGTGTEIEASEDGGKTWNTYTRCKVVDYGGDALVWAPPGKRWEWKTLTVKSPNLFFRGDETKPKIYKGRSIPVVVPGQGELDSYLDLTGKALHAIGLAVNSEGLVPESRYERTLDPEDLRRRAQSLLDLAMKAEKKADTPNTGGKRKAAPQVEEADV